MLNMAEQNSKKAKISKENFNKTLKTCNKSKIKFTKSSFQSITRVVESSSIHGIPQVVRTQRLCFKIIWILFTIGSSFTCSYFTIKTFLDYFNYDTITKIKNINEFRFQFPTVSICNYQNQTFELKILSCFYNFEDLKPKWKKHFEAYNDTRYGRCYRFNSGKNFYNQQIPIKYTTSSGYYYGLELNLYVETTNDFSQLKVYVHNHSMAASSLANKGYFITSGSYNHFAIDRIFNQLLEEPYNECYTDFDKFPFNKTLIEYIKFQKRNYSQIECLQLCQNLLFSENANCKCKLNSLEDILYTSCIKKQTDLNIINCTKNFIEEFQNKIVNENCSQYCPLECNYNRLVISQFSQTVQSRGKIKNTFNFPEFNTYENVSQSFFLIYVYFETSKITLISQQPKMQLFDLFSNIGGLFGLFLGMGVLSFLEIFEIIIELIIILSKNTFQQNSCNTKC